MKIICNLDYLVKNINKYLYSIILRISLCIFLILSINSISDAEIIYPEYTGQKVVDLSQKFDSNYLNKLESELGQYQYEIRIVFIDSKNTINLGFYAPKLFEKWKMSDDSILTVIDPYLNKTGFWLGKNVREELKKRKSVDGTENSKTLESGSNIDYQNLPSAIADKFSAEISKVIPHDDKKNHDIKEPANNYSVTTNSNSNNKQPIRPPNPYTLRIFLGIILLAILGCGGVFFYNRKQKIKRQLELKTTYSFDGEILSEQLFAVMEKISSDIEKMSKFKGHTKKEIISHCEKLNDILEKATLFSEKFSNSLEEIELDNLYYISELLDEGKMLVENLENIHKESLGFRKEFKAIFEKSTMNMSDIRVNIENCRNLLEEMRTLYELTLEFSENKINDCEILLSKAQELIHKNDPIEYRNTLHNIHESIKELKRDFEIIPHLHKQLKESIPQSIKGSLEESLLDNSKKTIINEEINKLRLRALDSLSKGNLDQSEEIIAEIFSKLNEVKVDSRVET